PASGSHAPAAGRMAGRYRLPLRSRHRSPALVHIVQVCPRYLPARGGAETFFARLSDALVARGDTVSIWTTDPATVRGFTEPDGDRLPPGPEWIDGTEVRRFPVRYVPGRRWTRTVAHWLPLGTRWKCDTLRWTPYVPTLTDAAASCTETVD